MLPTATSSGVATAATRVVEGETSLPSGSSSGTPVTATWASAKASSMRSWIPLASGHFGAYSTGSSTARTASAAALDAKWELAVEATPSQTTTTERPSAVAMAIASSLRGRRWPLSVTAATTPRSRSSTLRRRAHLGGRHRRGLPGHPRAARLAEELVVEDGRLARSARDDAGVGIGPDAQWSAPLM